VRSLWEWWKQVARRFADIQARVLLTVFYYVVLGPFAVVVRWLDPLAIKAGAVGGWQPRKVGEGGKMDGATRQF
jgi:hypothetical protein